MFSSGDKLTIRLRRFVSRRGAARCDNAPSLIADAAIQLLMPTLKDVLEDEPDETVAMRLTYATAMVMITDLLAQRLSKAPWSLTAALAIAHAAERSGLDQDELLRSAGRVAGLLAEFQPQPYHLLCRDMDLALERTIFGAERSQGEVLIRLALERLETMVQSTLVIDPATATFDAVRRHGLLRVVQTNRPATWLAPPAPRRRPWRMGRRAVG